MNIFNLSNFDENKAKYNPRPSYFYKKVNETTNY